ncbi:hypothetical protein D9M69_735050 [compost metagenome]
MRIRPLGASILSITWLHASMHRPQPMQAACKPCRMSMPVGQTWAQSVQSMQCLADLARVPRSAPARRGSPRRWSYATFSVRSSISEPWKRP